MREYFAERKECKPVCSLAVNREQFFSSLQPMFQNPGNPLIASKSGEHQLEHWLSLSFQPVDVSNWYPMCIKKLEEKVQLQPQRKHKVQLQAKSSTSTTEKAKSSTSNVLQLL